MWCGNNMKSLQKLICQKRVISQRIYSGLHVSSRSRSDHNSTEVVKATEVRIPVPWGHVAGKWWGPQNVRPILGLHGWLDNCGTFDTLAPLLPKDVGFLAIDYPGHGLSSRIPNGLFYSRFDFINLVQRIAQHYSWDKVSMLAHSMGGYHAFVYSGLYAGNVDFVISLDGLKPFVFEPEIYCTRVRRLMDDFLIIDKRNINNEERPAYTYEELIEKLYVTTNSSIEKQACQYILDRGIKKSSADPNKYYFSRDDRLKVMEFSGQSQAESEVICQEISCPYLAIKASDGPIYEDLSNYYKVVEIMKAVNPGFELHNIDGTHHVHLNEPTAVSSLINDFINRHYRPEKTS